MAVDMFLLIDGVKGESQDSKYKDAIDVLAWSWGLSNSGTTHTGSGSGAGKANIQDVSCTKWIDKSSPGLMLAGINGKHFKDAKIICRKAGEKPLEYLTITMTDVMITSVSTGGSGGEDRLTENLSLNFGKVKVEYTEQKKEGGEGTKPNMHWNIAQNKEEA